MAPRKPKDEAPEATPWSIEQVRARTLAGRTVECPSGLVVSLRRDVRAVDLALQGVLPDHLTPYIFRDFPEIEERAETPEERRRAPLERAETINAVCLAVIEAPAVSADGGTSALAITELPWRDRLYIFAVACEEVDPGGGLARFPGGSANGLQASPAGGALRDAAERDPRPSGG